MEESMNMAHVNCSIKFIFEHHVYCCVDLTVKFGTNWVGRYSDVFLEMLYGI